MVAIRSAAVSDCSPGFMFFEKMGGSRAGSARFRIKGEELLCCSLRADLIKKAVEVPLHGFVVRVDLCRNPDGQAVASIPPPS